MEISAIITAIIVTGLVWGGLSFFLSRAVRYEKLKGKDGEV